MYGRYVCRGFAGKEFHIFLFSLGLPPITLPSHHIPCRFLPSRTIRTLLRSLLQPLSWSHVYVPLLPRRMAGDLLQCPTPYLLGLDSETASGLELPKDAMQVSASGYSGSKQAGEI